MTVSNFDQVFGSEPPTQPSFTEKFANARIGETKATDNQAYRPYDELPTGSLNETCEVVGWLDGTEVVHGVEFNYRFLTQIGFLGEEELRLHFPDFLIVITGRRLRNLRKRLARRRVTYIQQYSARIWPERPPESEPIVTHITVTRPSDSAPR